MPKRITKQSVVVHRDGKPIRLKSGILFDFTKDEIEELKIAAPNALRTPNNELESVEEVKAAPPKGGKPAQAAQTGQSEEL
jgi:hypothetical protein